MRCMFPAYSILHFDFSEGNTMLCYAKINLFLEIQDKRPDGYHNLGTLFQTLECSDSLEAEPFPIIDLICPEGITAAPEQNLILRAAQLLHKTYANRLCPEMGIKFHLQKNLPMGAGLGGGSSNAAAALLLCNDLWNLQLKPEDLIPLAATLGADVPFFLMGGTFFGEGKGDLLKPAPEPFPFHVVIATPHCHVPTAWAYAQLKPKTKYEWGKFKALYNVYCEDPGFYNVLKNDFEAPMRAHFPVMENLFQNIANFAPTKAMLSGSGASVFALFKNLPDAEACLQGVSSQCRYSILTKFTF